MLSSVIFTSCVEAVTPPSAFEHKTVLICFQRFCQNRFFVIVDWNKKLLACDFQEYCSDHFLYKSTLTHFWGKTNADSTTHMQKWFHVGSCDTFQQSEDWFMVWLLKKQWLTISIHKLWNLLFESKGLIIS